MSTNPQPRSGQVTFAIKPAVAVAEGALNQSSHSAPTSVAAQRSTAQVLDARNTEAGPLRPVRWSMAGVGLLDGTHSQGVHQQFGGRNGSLVQRQETAVEEQLLTDSAA